MKRTRLLALAITVAMLILTVAAPLSVAEEVVISNEIDANVLAGADGVALDEVDLAGVEGIALDEIDLSDVSIGGLAGNDGLNDDTETEEYAVGSSWKNLQEQINSAQTGGGVFAKADSITIKNSQILNNTAKADGGGAFIRGGNFTLLGGKVNGNKAEKGSGGVYADVNTTKINNRIEINKNSCGTSGGGLFVKGSKFDLVSCTINGNSAKNGGGVYTAAGDAKFNGRDGEIQIRDNKASECGGGVYTASKNLWMKKGQSIEKNNSGSYGGGLYVAGNTIMANGRVTFNTSQAPGGGVYIQKGTFKITSRGRIANNKSQKKTAAAWA